VSIRNDRQVVVVDDDLDVRTMVAAAQMSAAAGLQKAVDVSGLLAVIDRVAGPNASGSCACPR
jgi:DNA-binding NtrC family response regulator